MSQNGLCLSSSAIWPRFLMGKHPAGKHDRCFYYYYYYFFNFKIYYILLFFSHTHTLGFFSEKKTMKRRNIYIQLLYVLKICSGQSRNKDPQSLSLEILIVSQKLGQHFLFFSPPWFSISW